MSFAIFVCFIHQFRCFSRVLGVGVFAAMLILMFFSRDNRPSTFLDDAADMLGTVGPLSMLPMLLASLGAVFTSAGVGTVISNA